jgi:hypothetical protein
MMLALRPTGTDLHAVHDKAGRLNNRQILRRTSQSIIGMAPARRGYLSRALDRLAFAAVNPLCTFRSKDSLRPMPSGVKCNCRVVCQLRWAPEIRCPPVQDSRTGMVRYL